MTKNIKLKDEKDFYRCKKAKNLDIFPLAKFKRENYLQKNIKSFSFNQIFLSFYDIYLFFLFYIFCWSFVTFSVHSFHISFCLF